MYTPLYIKTDNTLLTSLIKIDDLINYAKKNNIKSLTITDNKMYGAYEFYKKCKENNIKPIIGLEITLKNKIILYCKNYNGYKNLLKLTSREITLEALKEYNKDLICILPYSNINMYETLKNIYSDIFISYKNSQEQKNIKIPNKVYANEILCLEKEDEYYLKYLECIKESKHELEISDIKNKTIISYEKIKEYFNEDLQNNYKITDMCNLEIKLENNLLPKYDCNNIDEYSYLKKKCIEGLKRIFGETVNQVYKERLKYELEIINNMGFCNYFLVVSDYVNYAKQNGILVGPGRGSAAGSLVSYLLNITTIDPIKYDLLFERFLNPERITMPDIDVDFEYTRRQEVVDYCKNKYGEKRVTPIITFSLLQPRASIRDVGKVLNIPQKTIDKLSNMIDSKNNLLKNYQENIKIKNYLQTDEELKKLYKIAKRIEGLKRHTSIHAAGIVMSQVDLDEVIPLEKKDNYYITAYPMEYLEEQGLLKMDFLALKNLTIINNILKGINIDFDKIPLDDKETLDLLKRGQTNGIFQLESEGMKNFLKKFKPNNFMELVSTLALFRPGPMSNIDTYIKRKRGIEEVKYNVKEIEPILKPTYGIIIYQEQIMKISQVMAGYSLGEADILRRAMSKKKEEVLLTQKEDFINRSIQRGYTKEQAEEIYELILKFASYGFNKAHSVAYATISYKLAYLKVHYKLEFMCELLNDDITDNTKLKKDIYECKMRDINILLPDINLSEKKFIIKNNNIIYPIINIGICMQTVDKIISKRKEEYKDIFDFISNFDESVINKETLEKLIFSSTLDKLGNNKKTLIENMDKILNYNSLKEILTPDLMPIIEDYEEYDNKYLMEKELEIFGFYLSNHPVTKYKEQYNVIDLINIEEYFDKFINIVIYVDRIKELETKKNEKMCFITGSDETKEIDIVMFPSVYNSEIKQRDILYLNGKVEKRYDKYQFVTNKIIQIIK